MPLFLAPDAFKGIPQDQKERFIRKIDWLWVNRMVVTHQPLHGELSGFFKRRVGDYRIIYTYDNPADEMVIHLIGHRSSIYENI